LSFEISWNDPSSSVVAQMDLTGEGEGVATAKAFVLPAKAANPRNAFGYYKI
jgi:hypothetical protein